MTATNHQGGIITKEVRDWIWLLEPGDVVTNREMDELVHEKYGTEKYRGGKCLDKLAKANPRSLTKKSDGVYVVTGVKLDAGKLSKTAQEFCRTCGLAIPLALGKCEECS